MLVYIQIASCFFDMMRDYIAVLSNGYCVITMNTYVVIINVFEVALSGTS
jgi:hypothetical protein